MKMDPIGIYKQKPISTMTREELLDFARWVCKEMTRLRRIEEETKDYRFNFEIHGRDLR